ncbi:MAG: peptidylprolyl isomerase [candidate division Zixibacteria bacterium]
MMQTMRNSAKIVFFLVLVAFAGFMILQGLTSILADQTGGGKAAPPGVIGEIDGTPIPLTYFENAYRPRFRDLLQENDDPSDDQLKKIRDEIWNNLTTVTLLEIEAQRRGITVTNAEIVEYIKISPPSDLQGMPQFQTDGRFDVQKYRGWLQQAAASNDPQIISFLSNFENQIKQQITVSRLQEFVISMIRATPEEVRSDYMESNEKMKVDYFYIPNSDFTEMITDAPENELLAKYEEDKEKYKNPPKASISFVSLNKAPSDDDYALNKATVDSLYKELASGIYFPTVAKDFSDDKGSGARGGDLGWFSEGMMVDPFWQAVIKIEKVDEILQPIKTRFGWHIIKLTGKRESKPDSLTGEVKDEYKASHILLKVDISPQTIANLEEMLNRFISDATINGFVQTAADQDLEVVESDKFNTDGYIQGMGNVKEIAEFAFNSKKRDISPVITTRSTLLVCGLPEVTPESIPSYEEVEERVRESYLYRKRIDAAYEKAKEFAAELEKGKSFEEMAELADKQIQSTDYFARHKFVARVGSDPFFIGAAFNLTAENRHSKAVKARSGAYLLKYVDRQEPDTSFYTTNADSLLQSALNTKRQNAWPKFLSSLRNNAEIVDYRSFYYGR